MSPRYDVFLSHASADKPAVEFLAHKLRAAGIEPFLDKWHLRPGRIWQTDLEDGLRDSRACAIFIGSEGFGPWHQQEMLVALDRGARDLEFPVIPVLLPGFSKPASIPAFLAQRTWVEFSSLDDEDAFRRLVWGIGGESPKPEKPSRPYRTMAQPPEEFINRREYSEVLRLLCPESGTVQSVGITTALRGAGGFGKTALAQKLCQDPKVQETYPDGILWATMGEDIDANGRLSRIRDLIRWWTDKEAPAFETVNAAGAKFRELLATSRVLIVIDDVWSPADVTPFQGIGNGSALLITTRDSQTLPSGSEKIKVDAMASAEAVSLLRSGLSGGEERDFVALAARLGEWPLLLGLVNRQLRDLVTGEPGSVQAATKEVNEELSSEGFSAFNRDDPESRHAAASRTILVSLRRLQEKERERYLSLAVFPEDVQIPISVLERFWGFAGAPSRRFCRRLHELSLLRDLDLEQGAIQLHDVVRQVLMEQVGEELPNLHRHLLDAFRPASGLWSDLPVEERYLWRNLASHLLGAERKDELRRLLTDLSFLQAKLNATGVNALMADYQAFVEEERELRLIRDALRLSAHVLARDRQQLASQLYGRLQGLGDEGIQDLQAFLETRLLLRTRKGSLSSSEGPLLRTLTGHSGWVYTVAVLNGSQIVSGSADHTLRVWDLKTGEAISTLKGHSDSVYTVAVLDGCRVISGSNDKTLRVWNLATGKTLNTLKGHSDAVNTVAALDGRRVISGSDDKTLRVWDVDTGETIRILNGHSSGVAFVAVLDRCRAISGSGDCTLRVWDLETGKTLKILSGHSGWLSALVVLDGRRVVSASDDMTLRVWDLETGKTLRVLKGHSGGVNTVTVLDSRRAVSGSGDRTLRVWDLETGETLRILKGHSDWVYSVTMVNSSQIVSASLDWTLRVWDLEIGETFRTLEGHSGGVKTVAVLDNHRVVSGSKDKTSRVWDLKTGETLRILERQLFEVNALGILNSHQVISTCYAMLRIWNPETGEVLKALEGQWGEIHALAVWDGCQAISGADYRLEVWDLQTGEILRTLEGHSGMVNTVGVVEGRQAVSGSSDKTLRVWDLETGETLRTLEGHSNGVTAVAVVDGRRAVSGSDDGTLRVWDLETGETLRTLEGHSNGVNAVAVVDGRRAVSGSDDRTLRVWDLETGETLAVVTLDAPVWSVTVSPGGQIVVAGDQTGRVHFLDLVEPE